MGMDAKMYMNPVLQIRRGNRDNLENFRYFSMKNIGCDHH